MTLPFEDVCRERIKKMTMAHKRILYECITELCLDKTTNGIMMIEAMWEKYPESKELFDFQLRPGEPPEINYLFQLHSFYFMTSIEMLFKSCLSDVEKFIIVIRDIVKKHKRIRLARCEALIYICAMRDAIINKLPKNALLNEVLDIIFDLLILAFPLYCPCGRERTECNCKEFIP